MIFILYTVGNNGEDKRWSKWLARNKENILLVCGLLLTAGVFVSTDLGLPFHYEFLVLAAGMMGFAYFSNVGKNGK